MEGLIEEDCGDLVLWWDGEYEGVCERTKGHDGPHSDGLTKWDDEHREVD